MSSCPRNTLGPFEPLTVHRLSADDAEDRLASREVRIGDRFDG